MLTLVDFVLVLALVVSLTAVYIVGEWVVYNVWMLVRRR